MGEGEGKNRCLKVKSKVQVSDGEMKFSSLNRGLAPTFLEYLHF